jgi:phenol hydroxylase P0 protein
MSDLPSQRVVEASELFDRRFVRFRHLDARGFAHFDFSIGDPELFVELSLPRCSYEEFCTANAVTHLTSEEGERLDYAVTKWRYGQPGVWE